MNAYEAIAPFASFQGDSIEGTSFEGADLSPAKFSNVTMRGVDFSSSEASRLNYEPRLGHPPRVPTFRTTKGLDSFTTLNDGRAALTELQKSLSDTGLRGEAASVRQALAEAPRASAYRCQPNVSVLPSHLAWQR